MAAQHTGLAGSGQGTHLVVATRAGVAQAWHATLGHEQRGAWLRAAGDLELHRPIHCGDLDLQHTRTQQVQVNAGCA